MHKSAKLRQKITGKPPQTQLVNTRGHNGAENPRRVSDVRGKKSKPHSPSLKFVRRRRRKSLARAQKGGKNGENRGRRIE